MEHQVVLSNSEYNDLVEEARSAKSRKVLENQIAKATNCVMKIAMSEGKCIKKKPKNMPGVIGTVSHCAYEKRDSIIHASECRFYDACNYKGKKTQSNDTQWSGAYM